MMKEIVVGNQSYRIKITKKDEKFFDMEVNGKLVHVDLKLMHDGFLIFSANGKTVSAYVSADDSGKGFVTMDEVTLELKERGVDSGEFHLSSSMSSLTDETDEVRSPIPGKVVKILVQPGDQVKAGDPLLIVEAMKMENTIFSPKDGIVEKINCETGATVDAVKPLILFKKNVDKKAESV